MTAEIELDAFRLGDAPSMAEVVEKHSSGRRWPRLTRPSGEAFLRGPIPWDTWICRAAILPGAALPVGLVLWRMAFLRNSLDVKLTSVALKAVGVGSMAKGRALKELEAAGLVKVYRINGKNPTVEIIDNPTAGGESASETKAEAEARESKPAKPKKTKPAKGKSKPEMEISTKGRGKAENSRPLKATMSGYLEPKPSRANLVQLSLLNN